jgi:hypothetical protein
MDISGERCGFREPSTPLKSSAPVGSWEVILSKVGIPSSPCFERRSVDTRTVRGSGVQSLRPVAQS